MFFEINSGKFSMDAKHARYKLKNMFKNFKNIKHK